MAAVRTVPCSSLTSCGSSRIVAPCSRAWAMQRSTSGTSRARSIDAVAVPAVVVGVRAGRVDGAEDDEAGRAGLEHVTLVVADAGLGAAVADERHAEGVLVVVRALGRVAGHEDDGVHAGDRERVGGDVVLDQADQLAQAVDAQVGLALGGSGGQRVAAWPGAFVIQPSVPPAGSVCNRATLVVAICGTCAALPVFRCTGCPAGGRRGGSRRRARVLPGPGPSRP